MSERAELRRKWIEIMRNHDGTCCPFNAALQAMRIMGITLPLFSGGEQGRESIRIHMWLVDVNGSSRSEPLSHSIADMKEQQWAGPKIADAVEAGEYWAEWPE